ncbi:PLAT/LH2 domain-containing protein [Nonomuraea solani]|uniref:PLAT/LH2 domain-containing protein n=1 Tax=Nonomuraea solani TaxID=1144553 RepID=A0A1H6EIM3_9ACTN|nr:PLAT/LH2 domain-containing protein [Nonomuraea solani]SEG97730.1 PLAT/LH2 domain-containing protein [Nonomuraea solani]
MPNYNITVETGDVPDAGTNANVFLKIHGTTGSVGPTDLDNSEDNFERNAVDHFTLTMSSVGEVMSIEIGHDNTGNKPGWFLNRVIIDVDGQEAEFAAYRWLAKDENDHKTEVRLDKLTSDAAVAGA